MDGAETGGLRYLTDSPPAPGTATEVAEGVLWLRLPLPMALDHVNIFALREDDGWTIVDTGVDGARERKTWAQIMAGPLSGLPVVRVVATHHHPDHIGLAGWFQEAHGAELWAPRTAWLMARMLTLDVQQVADARSLDFLRAAGAPPEVVAKRAAERPFNFADIVSPLPLGYRRIREGQEVTFGGRRWMVVMGEGHAPEHATFWSRDDNLVLGGDQLLPSISPNLGVYATEPDADPVGDWLESCARLAPLARPDHLVLPGHKLPYTGLPLRLEQLAENHHGALARLWEYLDEPRVAAACFAPLFKRPIDDGLFGLALVETVAHLNHLLASGRATRARRSDGAWIWSRV